MPDVTGRTVYRIVQEGLTNAAKHAPARTVPVQLSGTPEEGIDVLVRNPLGVRAGPTPGAGLGLVGLTERAELRGGRLEAPRGRRRSSCTDGYRGRYEPPVIRVLVVDDDPLVRSALRLMLGGQPDLDVIGEAPDGRAGVAGARQRPDVVLMDIRMPVLNGLEATGALHADPDPPRVIVLTTFDADEHVLGALAAGADGFVLKDTPPREIVEAIRRVAAGDPMLSPSVTATLIRQVREPARPLRRGPRTAGRADRAGDRGRARGRARAVQRGDRRRAVPLGADGQGARVAAVREAAGHEPGADRHVRA